MRSKYDMMHEEIIRVCNDNHIPLICGKTPYFEVKNNCIYKAQKVFFVLPRYFNELKRLLKKGLKTDLYEISVISKKELERKITISRTDILATTVNKLMLNPNATLGPSIVIRTFKDNEDGTCSIIMNKATVSIPYDKLEDCNSVDYAGGTVFVPNDEVAVYDLLYGEGWNDDGKVAEYPIFEEEIDKALMLEEATRRGYFSDERTSRDSIFRNWRKERKAPAMKDYKEYRNRLLALGLPIEEEEDSDSE